MAISSRGGAFKNRAHVSMKVVMSLEAALARVTQIESAMSSPMLAGSVATPSGGAGLPLADPAAAAGDPSASFASTLQQAMTPAAGDSVAAADTGAGSAGTIYNAALGSPLGAGAGAGAGAGSGSLAAPPAGLGASSALSSPFATGGIAATPAQAMVQIAERELGQSEQPPGSNDSPRLAVYRTATAGAQAGEPWCAYFASWVARQAGEPLGAHGQGLGYVGDIWNWAQSTGRAIPNGPGVRPTPGDLIVFGDHHVGVVDHVLADGSIQTVEGNYSNRVSQVIRSPSEATGYVRM